MWEVLASMQADGRVGGGRGGDGWVGGDTGRESMCRVEAKFFLWPKCPSRLRHSYNLDPMFAVVCTPDFRGFLRFRGFRDFR